MAKNSNGERKERIAKWKIIGQVVVALLGAAGTVLAVWANTGLSDTVSRLDEQVIPSMQALVDELRTDNKTLVQTIADLRERLARIEGGREVALGARWFPLPGAGKPKPKADKVEKKLEMLLDKKPASIPMVQMAK
jgi:cell division protein FtsB